MSASDLTIWDKQLLSEAGFVWVMSSTMIASVSMMMELLQAVLANDVDLIARLSKDGVESMRSEQAQLGERRRIICRVLAKIDSTIQVPEIDTPGATAIDWDAVLQDIVGTD